MKKHFVILFILALIIGMLGCSYLNSNDDQELVANSIVDLTEVERKEEHHWRMPKFQAVNQYGNTVVNHDLEGSLTLVKKIFTSCPTVCLIMTPNMVQLQEAMDKEGIEGINIVSFTVDPIFDTPERTAGAVLRERCI